MANSHVIFCPVTNVESRIVTDAMYVSISLSVSAHTPNTIGSFFEGPQNNCSENNLHCFF